MSALRTDLRALADFVGFLELDEAEALVGELFMRKFRVAIPAFPRHLVALVSGADGLAAAACYTHVTDCGDLILGGGACTDDRVLRRLPAEQRHRLRAFGGIYRCLILHALEILRQDFPALFVYCGDGLSERVLRSAGFLPVGPEGLMVNWMQGVEPRRERQLVAKAASFIPF